MLLRTSKSIAWDIYQEHFDEAAFLWTQWEDALRAANYTLDEVAVGPEERLLAHLDGLVLGGTAVANDLLAPALGTDEPERAAATAWALAQAEDGLDYQDAVVDTLIHAEPPVRSAVARALSLAARTDVARIARLWPAMPQHVRADVLQILGRRAPERVHDCLAAGLRASEPALLAAALHELARRPEHALIHLVESELDCDVSAVRGEAVRAGVALRSERAWDACRALATVQDDRCRLPLGLLATSMDPSDRAIVRAGVEDPAVRRHALWALGFAGDIDATDVLVQALDDDDEGIARIAGESLATITGLPLTSTLSKPGVTKGPDVEEVGYDDPPPVVLPEDHLLAPDARAVRDWWRKIRGRLQPGVGHIEGRRRTPGAVHAALATASMWRREVLWLDWAHTTGTVSNVDLWTWTAEQRRQFAADAAGESGGSGTAGDGGSGRGR